jgi:DNA invertase Pin-like site-specific DNA recombinase
VTKTYVDQASANDLLHRTAWKRLQDDAIQHRFDAVLVFKLDRAFRSVKHMHDTLAVWDPLPIGFLSAQEGFDTATPIGRLLLNLLASLAEFELDTISERVRAGMARAKQEGKRFGNRPIETNAKKWQAAQAAVRAVDTGQLSYRQAAKEYGVSVSTIQRTQAKLRHQDPA